MACQFHWCVPGSLYPALVTHCGHNLNVYDSLALLAWYKMTPKNLAYVFLTCRSTLFSRFSFVFITLPLWPWAAVWRIAALHLQKKNLYILTAIFWYLSPALLDFFIFLNNKHLNDESTSSSEDRRKLLHVALTLLFNFILVPKPRWDMSIASFFYKGLTACINSYTVWITFEKLDNNCCNIPIQPRMATS